eukprot:COSAG02_NODE_626_length_19349_cov_11.664468_8_plen_138_part_00
MSTTNRQGVEISEGPGCQDEECLYKIIAMVVGGLVLMGCLIHCAVRASHRPEAFGVRAAGGGHQPHAWGVADIRAGRNAAANEGAIVPGTPAEAHTIVEARAIANGDGRFCVSCGAESTAAAKFCSACGAVISFGKP